MKQKTFFCILFLISFFIFIFPEMTLAAQPARPLYSWVRIWKNNSFYAESITLAKRCPMISIDGKRFKMQLHVAQKPQHPERVCFYKLPGNAKKITVAGVVLPKPLQHIRSVVFIGDTGCSTDRNDGLQWCLNQAGWPLHSNALQIAKLHPDMVVHLGDMTYAEDNCPVDKLCKGLPHGQSWQVWNTFYFLPLKPILAKTIWLNIRGNHENCATVGLNWFRYFVPGTMPKKCLVYTNPYKITWSDIDWYIIDNAQGEVPPSANQVAHYVSMLRTMYKGMDRPNWLIGHFPFYSMILADQHKKNELLQTTSSFKYASNQLAFNPLTKYLFTGHFHSMQYIKIKGKKPSEFVFGNGGVVLTPFAGVNRLDHQKLFSGIVQKGFASNEFGFLYMKRQNNGWHAVFYTPQGQPRMICDLLEPDHRPRHTATECHWVAD